MPAVKFAAASDQVAPPDPHRLRLSALAEKATLGAVDVKAGRISGVSLLTANREASGHGVWIDAKTLTTFEAQLKGRRLKAYATHGTWSFDGTLDEVGFWEGVRIDGIQLREDFQSLDAWRKHQEAEFDTLFELAQKLPEEFGASLAFRFTLAWVRTNGEDVETVRSWSYVPGEGYTATFTPAAPSDAVRADMPSVRCVEVYSADFVCTPAANDGLFRAGAPTPAVDAAAKVIPPASTQPALFAMIKQLNAKFGSNPALLARAIHFHAADDKATYEQVVALVEGEQTSADLAKFRQSDTQLIAFNAALDKAGFKAAGDKSALDVLLAEHAAFKANDALLTTANAALKTAGFEAKDGKSAAELLIAAYNKKVADIATLRAGGTPAVETGSAKPEGANGGAQNISPTARLAAKFAAKSPKPANN